MTADLSFEQLVQGLELSQVKKLLLKTLMTHGDSFPRNWVKSSELLKLSGQKYFDRRLRELRDQVGLDIESRVVDGEHCWRLNSSTISQTKDRAYLTTALKNRLFEAARNKCAVCGRRAEAGVRGLQADHKVPLIRGGTNDVGNWQALCNECNVAKRGTCKDCDLDCQTCAWAVPEKVGFNFVIKMPADLREKIENSSLSLTDIESFVVKEIRRLID